MEFVEIPNWEKLYLINIKGEIKNKISGKIIKNSIKSNQYYTRLFDGQKQHSLRVCDLIATTFLQGFCKEIHVLNFKNNNTLDFSPKNLYFQNRLIIIPQEFEIWKDVIGFEGKYKVSNLGNILSLNYKRSKKSRILSPILSNSGYFGINIGTGREDVCFKLIHRLVAIAFLPNPDNLPAVNHIDSNRQNNNLENLEWCTIAYNNQHSYDNTDRASAMKGVIGKNHPLSVSVLQYDILGNFIKEWDCLRDIERELGYNHSLVSACCRGKCEYAYGFIWRYKEII
jgi:hypothetical protein